MNGHPINWLTIENFVGYGNNAAHVIFVGIEERISSLDNLEHDLLSRSTFAMIMDLHAAHIDVGIAGTAALFDPNNPICQKTWRPMCDLMLRRENPNGLPNAAARSNYQANHLGRFQSDTLLTELLPYPHVDAYQWEHNLYVNRFPTREIYEMTLLPTRLRLLSEVFAEFPRDLIVCYGRRQWPIFAILIEHYRRLVGEAALYWQTNDPLDACSTSVGTTRIVLTNHFSRPPLSTANSLPEFYQICHPHPPR